MGDREGGAALDQPLQGLLDHPLRLCVHARRRLVQDEDLRVVQDGAGDRDALALAAERRWPRSPT